MEYCIAEILWLGIKANSMYMIQSSIVIRNHLKISRFSPAYQVTLNRWVLVGFGIFRSSKPCRVGLREIPCDVDIAQDHHDRSGVDKIFTLKEREVFFKVDFAQAVKLKEFLASVDDDEVVGDV